MMIITKYSFWASECENYFQIKWYHAETQMHVIEENLMKCHFIYEGGFFPELILHIHSPVVVFWFQCKHIFVETFWGGGGGGCVEFCFFVLMPVVKGKNKLRKDSVGTVLQLCCKLSLKLTLRRSRKHHLCLDSLETDARVLQWVSRNTVIALVKQWCYLLEMPNNKVPKSQV